MDGCTRGIYMWSPPFKITDEQSDGKTIQKRVIVLDSEGIDEPEQYPEQDENWTTKLFQSFLQPLYITLTELLVEMT